MFNWLVSSKKNNKYEYSEVPNPPKANRELAKRIKDTFYNPLHYHHSEEFLEELKEAIESRNFEKFQKRCQKIRSQELEKINVDDKTEVKEKLSNILEQKRVEKQIDKNIEEIEKIAREKDAEKIISLMEAVDCLVKESEEFARSLSKKEDEEWDSTTEEASSDEDPFEVAKPSFKRSRTFDFLPTRNTFIDHPYPRELLTRRKSLNMEMCRNPDYSAKSPFFLDPEKDWNPNPVFQEFLPETYEFKNDLDEIVVENENELTSSDMKKLADEIGEWGDDEYDDMPGLISDLTPEPTPAPSPRKIERENPEGYLEIFIGPMFSGKSSKAFFKLTSMADQRFSCLYVNSKKDSRDTECQDEFVTTHNSSYSSPSPKITCLKVNRLSEVDVSDYDYVAVDELQFFEDAYENVLEWVQFGKYVIIASLDGDCYQRKFGSVLDLIPHADQVTKLTAYCDLCRDNYGILKNAPFTARMTSDTSAELVGGTDIYKAMCRSCHEFHIDVTVNIV